MPALPGKILLGMFLAVAYVIAGKLGLAFAPGEGYATALFPPAGVAFAYVLVYGRTMLPWVFLGALLLNLTTGSTASASPWLTMTSAFGIAIGSMLQALVGRRLLTRFLGLPVRIETGAEAIRFAAGSALACIVGATLSTALLVALQLVLPGNLGFVWLTWWIGDSLGVILFTPLVLTFIGTPAPLWRARRRQLCATVGIGLLLLAAGVKQVEPWEKERTLVEFRILSQHLGDQLVSRLAEQEAFVDHLSTVMGGANRITHTEFDRMAAKAIARFNTTLQAVEWAPRVRASGRQAFEREQQAAHPGFSISERTAAGKLQVAPHRRDYMPVAFVYPLSGNEAAIGYDLTSNPERKDTVTLAQGSDGPVATPPLKLVQEQGEQQGMLLAQWVPDGANGTGLTVVVLRMGDFVRSVIGDIGDHAMVRLLDLDVRDKPIYDSFAGNRDDGLIERRLTLGKRSYLLQTAPTTAYLRSHRSWQSWTLLVSGLAFIATLGLSLLMASAQTARAETQVEQQTAAAVAARQEAEKAGLLLREAVTSIAQGFTIYDENDRLVLCNEAYLRFYETSRDLIVPGATFEEIVRKGAERGQYAAAIGRIDEWVAERVAQHQSANGAVIEQKLADGRWLMVVEFRTPSGFIVGNRIDITALKEATEALHQRELYLRATIDNLPFLFWLKDADSRFLSVNQMFAEACGRRHPEEVIGKTDIDVWPEELAALYQADDREVMASRRDKAVEEPVQQGEQTRWIETFKRPVIADDGTVLGTVGFARDITERKEIAQALADSEQRWELAVSGANDGIWDWNPATGQLYFSERWASMLGYGPGEIEQSISAWSPLIHPDDQEHVLTAIGRHLNRETDHYEIEYRMRCKDGSYKWILSRGRAFFNDEGQPIRMTGSHSDTTERREAQARVMDRTEQLNAIFALSPDGFVSFDREQRIKYVSPAFTRMTGLQEEELIGLGEAAFEARLVALCVSSARFRGFDALLPRVIQDGEAPPRELIELSANGRVLEVGLRLSNAETVSKILYCRDVTHEVEVDRMKSEFLSTAAHELRTPMASIYGFAEVLLLQDFDEETRKDLLATIYRQSSLMASIINELLDLARIEARRGKDFVIEPIDLHTLVADAVSGYKPPEGRALPLAEPPPGPLPASADRKKIQQAVINLLSNAYKYSPAGGDVRISYGHKRDRTGPMVGVTIADSGIGMSPEQLERVFERFYRADTSGKIPGTGLGMSIVKEIIELHHGSIELESRLGKGTTVTLWLPEVTETAS